MKANPIWVYQIRRLVLILLGVSVAGWITGETFAFLALASLAILVHWCYQLWRIQDWLNHPDDNPPEGIGIWGDIFDRIYHLRQKEKETRGQLQAAVDYLRDSFSSMHDGVVMVDADGGIEWCNSAAGSLLGLRFPEDRGQGLLNLVRIPEFHRYYNDGDFSESLQLSVVAETELFLQIDITGFGDGNRLVFIRDVTALTRLEKMRRDFVGNVSHELRTPLTVISGYLDTMLDNRDNIEPRFIKPLEQMSQQARRMEGLLRDLLWLSRIESIENLHEHEPIDVAALIEDLIEEFSSNYPERTIRLEVETDTRVQGDYRELHSAISNLVLNAIKYSPDDRPVTVRWRLKHGDCELAVIDEGQGIATPHLPRLTERFYRVDDSRSAATGGTGLGLAIVKHVAASHSGRLEIKSKPGKGSTFTLVLPVPDSGDASGEA